MAFFYGWTHDYINGLPYEVAIEYFEAITVIEAQNNLIRMNVGDYSNKMKDRKGFYRDMRKKAEPQGLRKEIEFEDFLEVMKNG